MFNRVITFLNAWFFFTFGARETGKPTFLRSVILRRKGFCTLIYSKQTEGLRSVAVEIKSSDTIDETEVKSLERLASSIVGVERIYYLSQCKSKRKIGGVLCLY